MTRETMNETEIEKLVVEIRDSIGAMRKARLLTKNALLSHIGKNNALLRGMAETLADYGFEVGDTRESRKLMIWNEYLKMELERVTKIPTDMRKSAAITAKATTTTRIKIQNVAATTAPPWRSNL